MRRFAIYSVTLALLTAGLVWAAGIEISTGGAADFLFDGGHLLVTLGTALSAAVDSITTHVQKTAVATEGQTSCASTDTQLIAANASRIGFHILNQSPTPVYISYSQTATTTNGIRLEENMSLSDHHYTGEISCITSSGTATVARKEL